MDQVKLGIIGLGNMGSGHCNNILAGLTPELKLTAAADLRQSRRDWAKETLPDDVVLFENGDQLIESGLCDAVIIATPHYEHPRLAILAFEHGLHVMSEKPAGVYTKQVREMNEAAIRSGKVFGMMFNQRTNCIYRKMHEMVQSGKYGQIKRVNWIITDWYRTQAYYNSGGWRATWDGEGGGVLLNQNPHNLDLWRRRAVKSVPAQLRPPAVDLWTPLPRPCLLPQRQMASDRGRGRCNRLSRIPEWRNRRFRHDHGRCSRHEPF